MSTLKFNDGMAIDTSGDYRVIRKRDGYYVVGNGFCIPVQDYKEGRKVIEQLKG